MIPLLLLAVFFALGDGLTTPGPVVVIPDVTEPGVEEMPPPMKPLLPLLPPDQVPPQVGS